MGGGYKIFGLCRDAAVGYFSGQSINGEVRVTEMVERFSDFLSIRRGLGPDGRIAVVRFDRGDGLNALSPQAMGPPAGAPGGFEDEGNPPGVLMRGGTKAFSGGFDLKAPKGPARRTMDM